MVTAPLAEGGDTAGRREPCLQAVMPKGQALCAARIRGWGAVSFPSGTTQAARAFFPFRDAVHLDSPT